MPTAVESINNSVPSAEVAESLPSPQSRKPGALVLIADASGKGGMHKNTGSAWESMGAAETWRSGSGPPADTLGFPGDFYLDTASSEYYGPKDATDGWGGSATSLVGPRGYGIVYGARDPGADDGVDGEFWINTATNSLFGPKADGAWPAGESMVGPQGIQGIQGETGDPGAGVPEGGAEGQTIRRTDTGSTEWAGPDAFVGEMKPYGGATSPSAAWMICDGSVVSRTEYADLFGVLGTVYGAGDGSTTFNLPDMRGRTAVGSGQGAGLVNRSLGGNGGQEVVALTEAHLPAHSHTNPITASTSPDLAHIHDIRADFSAVQSGTGISAITQIYSASTGGSTTRSTQSTSPSSGHNHSQSATGSIGSGSNHGNMQPWLGVNYLIKVAV